MVEDEGQMGERIERRTGEGDIGREECQKDMEQKTAQREKKRRNFQREMGQRNHQKEMERVIQWHQRRGEVPRLLLHSCCAPCSSYVLEYLSRYFWITVLYYNPNIYPPEEILKRADEQERLIATMPVEHTVAYLEGSYEPELFFAAVKGHEEDREGGERCALCYRLRLEEAARQAKAGGFDYFTTTLSISPLKNAGKLNEIGEELAAQYGVAYLSSDFKKKDGYKRSTELSREYGLYRQDYCGCVFSKRERDRQREGCP